MLWPKPYSVLELNIHPVEGSIRVKHFFMTEKSKMRIIEYSSYINVFTKDLAWRTYCTD